MNKGQWWRFLGEYWMEYRIPFFSPVHLLPEINYIFLSFMPKLSKKDLK